MWKEKGQKLFLKSFITPARVAKLNSTKDPCNKTKSVSYLEKIKFNIKR